MAPRGKGTLNDDIDQNLIHDDEVDDDKWADSVDHPTGSVRASGNADASDLPVQTGTQGPVVDDSGHIRSADTARQRAAARGQRSSLGAAKDIGKAIKGNEPSKGGGMSGSKEKPEGAANKAADAAKDASEIGKAAASIESPTAWITLAKQAKKHWRGLAIVAFVPIALAAVVSFVLFSALANPTQFLSEIASQIGYKETAQLIGQGVFNAITHGGNPFGMLPGEVAYHGPNTAIADTNTPAPAAGSFADKVSKIDWNNAQYQTVKVNCPYTIETAAVQNTTTGQVRNAVKDIKNSSGQVVGSNSPEANAAASCIEQRYPILNTILRQPSIRNINSQVGIHLNYATPSNQLPKGDNTKQATFFRDKTLERVQDHSNQVATDNQDVAKAIQKAADLLKNGKSPDQISFTDIGYTLPPADTPALQRANAICAFGDVLLTPHNIGESVWSRANAARRAAYKIATLADTGKYHAVSAEENNATMNALANWDESYAYQREVYARSQGQNIDPEATNNRAIGVNQVDSNSQSIADLHTGCSDLQKNGGADFGNFVSNILGFFHLGGSTQEERNQQAIDKINEFYNNLTQQIAQNSNGFFATPNQVSVEEVIVRMVRIGSNVTVSGVEGGPQDFNRQAMGYRQNAFDNMLAIGGRFLTPAEAATNTIVAEDARNRLDQQKGIAWRLFDTQNTHSVASNIYGVLTNPPKVAAIKTLKISLGLLNPVNFLTELNDKIAYVGFGTNNHAIAATDDVDQYFQLNPVGFTNAELSAYNPLDLAKQIEVDSDSEDLAAMAQYDTCFKTEVTNQLFLYGDSLNSSPDANNSSRYQPDFQYAPDDIKGNLGDPGGPNCAELYSPVPYGPRADLIKRYRLYRYYNQMVDSLDYLSQPGEDPSLSSNATNSSLDVAGSTIDPNLPSGSGSELISQINDTHNVTFQSGTSLSGVKNTMLAVFLRLAQNYKITVSSTVRPGCGCPHGNGSAIDISQVDGKAPSYSGWDPRLQQFETDAASLLPSGSWMGFPNNDYMTKTMLIAAPRGVAGGIDTGTGPHFHLNVPASAP